MNMRTCGWIMAGLVAATPLWADDLLDGLADPTRPSSRGAAVAGVSRGGLVLQSTLVSPERSVAVISGQRLAVGGSIGGAEVLAIRPYEVILRRAGKQSTLRMLPKSDVGKQIVEAAPNAQKP
jgi:hypothetical protein